MEKGPKIGESLEGDIAIPEFRKQEFKVEIPKTEPEDEEAEISTETEKTWFEIIVDAKNEFPEEIQTLLEKRIRKENFSGEEHSKLDKAIHGWWKDRFGVSFLKRNLKSVRKKLKQKIQEKPQSKPEPVLKSIPATKEYRKARELKEFQASKIGRMEKLHLALKNLDEGEPVDEFKDETRRILYFDEENAQYYIEEDDTRKDLGIGDILADYAWGIKYVPGGEMTEPAYRTIAKRILINETRRDLEVINDEELVGIPTVEYHLPTKIEDKIRAAREEKNIDSNSVSKKEIAILKQRIGHIAEAMAREFLTRTSINNDLDFAILRANLVEDFEYRYDFKLRLKKKLRGIKVEDGNELQSELRRLGIQFSASVMREEDKFTKIQKGKILMKQLVEEGKLKKMPVDEILLLKIPGSKIFLGTYLKWLETGKPSGGPEQFLSRDLKVRLLKEVTRGLIEIGDEDIEKIFPPEN